MVWCTAHHTFGFLFWILLFEFKICSYKIFMELKVIMKPSWVLFYKWIGLISLLIPEHPNKIRSIGSDLDRVLWSPYSTSFRLYPETMGPGRPLFVSCCSWRGAFPSSANICNNVIDQHEHKQRTMHVPKWKGEIECISNASDSIYSKSLWGERDVSEEMKRKGVAMQAKAGPCNLIKH